MRAKLALLFAAAVCAMAQGRGGGGVPGGMPGGGMPGHGFPAAGVPRGGAPFLPQPLYNPFPFPTFAGQMNATINGWPAPPPGFGTFPRRGFGTFGALNGFGGAAGFGAFGGGYYGGGAYYPPYPPYPPIPPPQSNVTVVLPPSHNPPPPPIVFDDGILAPTIAPAAAAPPASVVPDRVAPTEFPAVVSVKDGWTYSATSYWTKGSTFHFITTSGQHLQIPMSRLERLYPAQKDGRTVASPGIGR